MRPSATSDSFALETTSDHPKTRVFLEFPRGPLSICRDLNIQPIQVQVGHRQITALSPTDSCRDRLAAFYFWNDRQSLDVAIQIALRNRVDLSVIRRWSRDESMEDRYDEFLREMTKRRRKGLKG